MLIEIRRTDMSPQMGLWGVQMGLLYKHAGPTEPEERRTPVQFQPSVNSLTSTIMYVCPEQTFSNFFRFPMIFLCGLFFPIDRLPVFLRPLSYILPPTYGVDVLQGAVNQSARMPFTLSFAVLSVFCAGFFMLSLRNIRLKWIV